MFRAPYFQSKKTHLKMNNEESIISELLERLSGDVSLINSYKKDLREMYVLTCEGKAYREDFTQSYRDSLGFTFRKLSNLLDAVSDEIEN
jgi:hypothetical protein